MNQNVIEVSVRVFAKPESVWTYWTSPEHIKQWNSASKDWHTPRVSNELKEGGQFLYRMETRNGKQGFDFKGKYTYLKYPDTIEYTMDDGRKVTVSFKKEQNEVLITERFEADQEYPEDMQREGWQSILDNFKKYIESSVN